MLQMIRNMPNLTTVIPELKKPSTTLDLKNRIKDRLRGKWLTKYIEAIKFDNQSRVGGVAAWKHAAPYFDTSFAKAETSVIFILRNPYSWLISLYKHPHHAQGISCETLEQFTDFPWMTIPKDRIASVVNSPMCLWNEKLRAYADFQDRCDIPFHQIRFEDFVQNPVEALTAALVSFGFEANGLAAIPLVVKNKNHSATGLADYYQQERWRLRLTRQSVALINQHTDWQVAERFGFKKLDPKQFPIEIPQEYQARFPDEFLSRV